MRNRNSIEGNNGNKQTLRERLHLDRGIGVATSVGAAAVAGALVVSGVTISSHAEKAPQTTETGTEAGSDVSYEAILLALQKVLVGGNTDGTSHGINDYLNMLGMIRGGDQIHLVGYPADVARQRESSEDGANKAVQEVNASLSRGEPVMLIGFSLGGDVVARAGQKLAEANGGVLPPGVKVVSYGGPASSTGFWASLPGEVGAPWASLFGVDMSTRLPAGSDEHSDQNDIWGNGAGQYLSGTLLQAIATGTGSHRIPGENEPRIVWTDEYGVNHFRYSVGENPMIAIAKSQNMYMAPGSEGYWNAAANAAFPINNGRDGLPNPDGQALIDNLARAFDAQAGTGDLFYILSRFIPGPFVQFGLDLVNKVPNALAEGFLGVQNNVLNGANNVANGLTNIPNNLNQFVPSAVADVPQSVTNPESVQTFNLGPSVPEAPQDAPAPEVVVDQTANSVNEVVQEVVPAVSPEVPTVPSPDEVVNGVVDQVTDVVEPPVPAPVEAPAETVVEEVPDPVVVEAPAPVEEAPVVAEVTVPVAETPVPVEAPAPVVEVPAPTPTEVVNTVVEQVAPVADAAADALVPAPAQ